jgi:hypothetical protein
VIERKLVLKKQDMRLQLALEGMLFRTILKA